MSVEGIHIWVEGVARAAPAAATTSINASEINFAIFFITHSFVN
jgi:hypothetical protein